MRLEILVGSNDPITYPFKSAKLIVGSADTCDIVIRHKGVSRKHLLLLTESGKYFVIDQGSTNGTFINEERLIPGRKVEFTSFFPMRLGDDVLVSLLSDEEYTPGVETFIVSTAPKDPIDRSTKVLSLKDLNKVKTDQLVQKRASKRAQVRQRSQSAPVKKKKIQTFNFTQLFALSIVLGAAYYNFFLMPKNVPVEVARVGEFVKNPDAEVLEEKIEPVSSLIPETELTKFESFSILTNDLKCITDIEKYFCGKIPGADETSWGAVQVGTMINVMVLANYELSIAKNHVTFMPDQPGDYTQRYNDLVKQAAAFKFLSDKVPDDLDFEMFKDLKLSFALFHSEEGEFKPYLVIAITSQALKAFKAEFTPGAFTFLKQFDSDLEKKLKTLYRVY